MNWIKPIRQFQWLIWCTLFLVACATSETQAQTVYITRTGAKYHEGSCRYLRQSKIAIEIDEAQQRGYTACSVCDPDSGVEEEEVSSEEAPREPRAQGQQAPKAKQNTSTTTIKKSTTSTSSQCSAYTKAGSRCKRSASSNGRCWQHQ